jgi:hypothetical protein
MEARIDPMELVKNQDTNAYKWALAFVQTIEEHKIVIDQSTMISWFANAIMCMHDKLYNTKIAQLEATCERYKKALEWYGDLDNWVGGYAKFTSIAWDDVELLRRNNQEHDLNVGGKKARAALGGK